LKVPGWSLWSLVPNDVKPSEFLGLGAMDVAKPYKFIGFGAMDVTKAYKFYRVFKLTLEFQYMESEGPRRQPTTMC
jgi:hypothetical protein